MSQLTFFAEEPPASPSASQDCERDFQTHAATSCSPILPMLQGIGPSGWFGRTSPAFFPPGRVLTRRVRYTRDKTSGKVTKQVISHASLPGLSNSGMGGPTEALTLSLPVWHSAASVCSLSDVLEVGPVPARYFLSATACRGILRRAEKRGKDLPPALLQALQQVAEASSVAESRADKIPLSPSACA